MSHHIEDGRVWAVDQRTGEKRRVMPHVIPHSKHLALAPSERAKGKSVQNLTEPKRPKKKRTTKRVTEPAQPATEPALESEPDSPTQPATEPGETSEKEK